ncbi:ABC transporter substrate-binding protein [Rubrimonas cliftonensis]|uniref:ABC transporter substrate-binding protein n=1 Tax=Rubrimonas cliftonensis TaxID=89524 RepID=UPI0015878979|nr:ABC transporter substrate-binding protein [Rubrimonas cliftonensis]
MLTKAALASCLLVAVPHLAPQASAADKAPPAQQVLRLVTANMPRSLDPTNIDAQRLINNGFGEPLVHQSFDGTRLIGALATDWAMVEPTRWRVELQPQARFWSGAPVTAEAVAASLRRHQTENPRTRTTLRDVEFVAAGPNTLEIVTPTENPAFLFSLVTLPIENVAAIAALGAAYATTGDMTGYFRPVEFIPGELIAGVPFDGHHGPRPHLERIEARFVVDPQTRYLALLSGQAEMDANVQFEQRRLYLRNPAITITERARSTWNVWMNYTHPLLGDPLMRQALSLGVNRDEIVSRVMAPFAVMSTAHFPAGLPYAIERTQRFDPAQARAILDEMGWVPGPDGIRRKDGQVLEFRVLTYGWWQTIAVVLESQWRDIGVRVSLQVVEPAASNQIMLDGAFEIATYCSCPAPTGDLHGQLRQYHHSGSVQNWQRYANADVDALLEALRTEADPELRYALARDIQEILFDDTALLWVSNASVLSNAHAAQVRGVDPERPSDITPGMFIAVR